MLRNAVLYAGICLLLSSLLLVAIGERIRRGRWLASLLLITAVAVAGWELHSRLVGGLPFAATIATAFVGGTLIAAAFPSWNAPGHAAFTAVIGAVTVFLCYVAQVFISAHLGPWTLALTTLVLV